MKEDQQGNVDEYERRDGEIPVKPEPVVHVGHA